MPLATGETLTFYEILGPLGAGGMGEVYRAKDTRLEREVAIKVLPEELADDDERLRRFEREAKTLASLNHANLAHVYGIDQVEGTCFIAMELVPGEDLATKLARGRMPIDETIDVCRQVAEGLEAAHEAGVVHRDLKPANVRITPEGVVKLLDFGLAKPIRAKASGESGTTTAESDSFSLTEKGLVLGTPTYMSPEQARGRQVDRRTDIWAFGCVLYECLTGARAFEGETLSDVLAAVLQDQPDWTRLPSGTPAHVRGLMSRCVQKDPRRRLRDIGDARLELEEGGAGAAPAASLEATPGERSLAGALVPALGGMLLGAALAALWTTSRDPGPGRSAVDGERTLIRSRIELAGDAPLASSQLTPFGYLRPSIALSPDGRRLAWVADVDGRSKLFTRALDETEAHAIAGSEGGFDPFFSPDGDWLAFFTENKLRRVLLEGGAPETICDAESPSGGVWSGDTIFFADSEGGGARRVPATGGTPRKIRLENAYFSNLGVLPGGEVLLLASTERPRLQKDLWNITLLSLSDGAPTVLPVKGCHPRYVPSGHLVFVRGGGLMAVRFDLETLTVSGEAFPVLDGLMSSSIRNPGGQYALSETGLLAWVPGGDVSVTAPVWVDMQGKVETLPIEPDLFGTFRLSPRGRRLAILVASVADDIRVYDLSTGRLSRLTLRGDSSGRPIWTPDGTRVTFGARYGDSEGLFWKRADGVGKTELLSDLPDTRAVDWSPDGEALLVYSSELSLGWIRFGEEPSPDTAEFEPLGVKGFLSRLSPDQRWVAYTSAGTGQFEVFVRGTHDSDRVWQVSDGGGEEPTWSPDGTELYYRAGSAWFVVSVTATDTLELDAPELLFRGSFRNPGGHSYDIHPDGQRFLMLQSKHEETSVTQISLAVNAFALLE